MHRLAQRRFPLGPGQLDQQLADLREAAEARSIQNRLDVLRAASITSATGTALHLPPPPLELFSRGAVVACTPAGCVVGHDFTALPLSYYGHVPRRGRGAGTGAREPRGRFWLHLGRAT